MDPITEETTRELDDAFKRWTLLEQRALQEIDDAELRYVGLALAAAIQLVPIDWPAQTVDDVIRANPSLRKHVNHLALVARALRGFRHGGTVSHDATPLHFQGRLGRGLFRVNVTYLDDGWATYLHVRHRELKKAGKTGDGETFDDRMRGTYNCIRKVIHGGEPYVGDPFKRRAPYTILGAQQMDLWVKPQPTHHIAKVEEDILNEFYRGEWSKEGWKKRVRRPSWPAELHEWRAGLGVSPVQPGT